MKQQLSNEEAYMASDELKELGHEKWDALGEWIKSQCEREFALLSSRAIEFID